MWFPLLHFWLIVFQGQVLPLYLWRPQGYPQLAKLEETKMRMILSTHLYQNVF